MKVFKDEKFIIVDNFLKKEEFIYLNNFLQTIEYQYVHCDQFQKAFKLNNNPLRSNTYLSHNRKNDIERGSYPYSLGIDYFFQNILKNIKIFELYIGEHKKAWDFFFCRPYLYPRETNLDWHTDGKYGITGAYVYFAHKQWSSNWGGELLIDSKFVKSTDYPTKEIYRDKYEQVSYALDNSKIKKIIENPGYGSFIYPKPNRLVIFKPFLWHKICEINKNAGENYRLSLTGFFMSEEKINSIKRKEV